MKPHRLPYASSLFPAPTRVAGKACGLAEAQRTECDARGVRWELVLFRPPVGPITPAQPHGDEYARIATCFTHGAARQAEIESENDEPRESEG